MRFAGLVRCFALSLVAAAGCAAHRGTPAAASLATAAPEISGVWDAVSHATVSDGAGTGDVRIEKQEWHLSQSGSAIRGYYIAALTYVSGDGRPYVCSRQPQFSALQRFEVAGHVKAGAIEIQEMEQAENPAANRCDPGLRQLARYRGLLDGDVLTLVSGRQQTRLYRIHDITAGGRLAAETSPRLATRERGGDGPATPATRPIMSTPPGPTSSSSADVSGLWVWEHQGSVPGG